MYTIAKIIGPSLATEVANEASKIAGHLPELMELTNPAPEGDARNASAAPLSLFTKHHSHITDDQMTAFTTSIKPHFANALINAIINSFKLPDL